ncbi:hypothetical protein [Halostella litorea]|nr:hypothetical protein [Halostella litorea]
MNYRHNPGSDSGSTADGTGKRGIARKLLLALALAAFSYLASRWSEAR